MLPQLSDTAQWELCHIIPPATRVQFHPEHTEANLRKMFEQSVDYFLTSKEAEAATYAPT